MDQFACGLVGTRTPYGIPGVWVQLQAGEGGGGPEAGRACFAGAPFLPLWLCHRHAAMRRMQQLVACAPSTYALIPSLGHPPCAANAFDDRFTPGGSSCGSAVAVAEGLCTFALGTDTAGSGGCSSCHA